MRLRLAALLTIAAASSCGARAEAATLANPASVYCGQRGGRSEIAVGANGGQQGICVLRDGTRVDEWSYFRNNHRTTH